MITEDDGSEIRIHLTLSNPELESPDVREYLSKIEKKLSEEWAKNQDQWDREFKEMLIFGRVLSEEKP